MASAKRTPPDEPPDEKPPAPEISENLRRFREDPDFTWRDFIAAGGDGT
jgi:hypothetical protein